MSTKKGKDDKSKGEDQDTPNNKGKGGAADKKPPKSLYERLVGKSAVTNETKRGSVKTALLNWFAKESAEERAFRSTLKNYRGKLTLELQQITKAVNRHQRRYQEQRHEFDKQEKQLIAWGLKGAIQKFHMQAWFRLERCKLQEKITSEIEKIVSQRQSRSIEYLQHFEETAQKKDKFSLREAEEFCQTPESLIMLDSVVLHLHERLKKLDLLCTYATRQFLLLEPEFAWKDTKKRSKILYTILMNYNNLPQVNHLDNIETDLSWEQFCMWCAVRAHKLKQIEQEYSDFIEDQRELEGRLFFRWHSSVMLTIKSPDQAPPLSNATRESTDGLAGNGATDPEHLKSRPTALKVTPGSIKAFIRYFATEIIGVKYEIPKECLQASIALTESLFFRRLSPYIFRYIDKLQREKDDYWRLHAQKCRYISPAVYSVPDKYFKGKSSNQNKESSKDATTPPTLHPQLLQHHGDVYRASSVAEQERMRLSVEFPTFSSFQMAQQKGGVSSSPKKNPPVTNNTNAPTNNNNTVTHTPFHPSAASFIVSPPSRDTETQANNTATVSTAPPSAPSNITETPESSHRKEGENRPTPAVLFTPEASNASIHPQKNETNADVQYLERLSYDEQELQFPIEVANNEKGNTENQHEIDTSDEDVEKVKSKRAEIENIRVKSKSEAAMLESHASFAPESYNERVETGDILATINSVTASTTPTAATSIPTSSLDSVERKDSPPPSIVPPVIANSVTTPSNPSTTLIAPVPISNSQNKGNGNGNGGGKGPSRQNSPGLPSKPSNSNGGQASPLKRVHVNYCTCHYCQTFSLSLRLQRFPKYEPGMEDGLPYARSSRVLSWMNLAVYPREMIFYLSLACKWILRDAIDVSGSRSVIGADTMVPLFTMVLIHARIPNIHLLLYILMQYGEYDEQGDISYNIANLEGSMQFIMQMEISNEIEEAFQLTALCDSILSSIKTNGNNRKGSTAAMVMASSSHENTHIHDNAVMMASSSPSSFNEHALKASFASVMSNATGGPPQLSQEEMKALDMKAMQELGEWLRDQQTMEETIAILQNDGWML